VSPDGDQGYPGRLEVTVTYAWSDAGELRIDYEAVTDRATPINLTNHAYFNLAGDGDVLGHELWMDADRWLPIDRAIVPTGTIARVDDTAFDFRTPRRLDWRLSDLLPEPGGYDHCLVFREGRDPAVPCVRLREPRSGRALEVITDQPGVQLYSGNHFDDLSCAGGVRFPRHGGLCLETQHFPDSVHHPDGPSVVLRPGERFASATTFRFTVER
jgi:aldose 1-epimerase